MKLSIDATGLGGVKTGTAVYVTEILRCWCRDESLRHQFVIFASPKTAGYLRSLGLDKRFSFVDAPDSRVMRIFWQQIVMPWHLARLDVDVHWGCGFVLPVFSWRRMVVTIYDLTFQLFPSVHEPVKRYYFPAMMAIAIRKARRIIAISAATEADLHRILPESKGKTAVTLLAPRFLPFSERGVSSQVLPNDNYIVCLGTLEPRKNIERLLEAWLGIAEVERAGVKLVVIGVRGWMVDQFIARHQGADQSVVIAGYLDDCEVYRIMQQALALAYPSLYEGFGLPVLEAMSLGVPVLTSDVGATREISGNAALLVDPTDVSSIREGLIRLLGDRVLREKLAQLGRVQAGKFCWEKTAQRTLDILEEVSAP